jgi:hypothetical protein
MSDFVLQFDYRVAGIPCQIGVLNYERHAPMSAREAHSDLEFYGYSEADYVVLDRRGRPAPWLQRKLDDDSSIIDQINELMEDPCGY